MKPKYYTCTITLAVGECDTPEQAREAFIEMLKDDQYDSRMIIVDPDCALCGAAMYTRMRGHHHTEPGQDITRLPHDEVGPMVA